MHTKQTVTVLDSDMEALLFMPEGEGPHPGLIVCQHIPVVHAGLETDPWQISVGERLATKDFAIAMPWLFHWWPAEADIAEKRQGFRDDWAVSDLATAFDLLDQNPKVDSARLGIIGHCWGGQVSWLGACHERRLKVLFTLYGGRITESMADAATPPSNLVDRMKCQVLGIYDNDDKSPSTEEVDDLDAVLTAAGVEHEFVRYEGAGHGFQDDSSPERYRAAQSEDAWKRIFTFLNDKLVEHCGPTGRRG